MSKTIFLSYCWKNFDIADQIDVIFQPTGVNIKRDVRDIQFKGSIREYMLKVRETDYVLMIISQDFLKSSNAMFEVLELLKDKNFKDRILPILVDNTPIYKPEERFEYIEFWTNKHKYLKDKLNGVNPTDTIDLFRDLKHYENIKSSIGEFLEILNDMDSPKISEMINENFRRVFNYIGVTDRKLINEILTISKMNSDDDKEIAIDILDESYPNNAKVHFLKASFAFSNHKIKQSNRFYRKSILFDSNFGASYYNLAYNIEIFDQNYIEAIELYKKSIELDPYNTRAHINLANIYSSQYSEIEKSLQLLDDALNINQFDPEIHFVKGVILHEKANDFLGARVHYEFAIDHNKNLIKAKLFYGKLLAKEFGEFDKAKKQFLEILEINPNDKNTLKQLAKLYEHEYKDFSKSKLYFDRFISIEPNKDFDHYEYFSFLFLCFKDKYKSIAKEHYNKACSINPTLKSDEIDSLLK